MLQQAHLISTRYLKMTKMKNLFSVAMVFSMLISSSCKKNKTANLGMGSNAIHLARDATHGSYLTTGDGLTLYMFANDADGLNTCTGGCEATWPVFTADLTTAKLDAGLTAIDFTTVTTASGKKQVTYKGWPLYSYSPSSVDGYGNPVHKPELPGSTQGDGIGQIWFIAKPDYTIMIANKQLKGFDGNNYKSDYTVGAGNSKYFTNGQGRAIYIFTVDSFNINKFTKADFSNNRVWPIYEEQKIVVPSILDKTLFGNITVSGKKQMTYKGWPLYHFGQDTVRGLNLGVSIAAPGKWPVASKDISEAKK